MSLKRFLARHPQHVSPLHHYQLGIIFAFVVSFVLFILYLMYLEQNGLDQRQFGWYFIVPWTIFYSAYCLRLRSRITPLERVSPLKRPIVHWAVMGLSVIYLNAIRDTEFQRIYPAFDFAFAIFTVFMADSYWDFIEFRARRADEARINNG